jgi:hypothetical protein
MLVPTKIKPPLSLLDRAIRSSIVNKGFFKAHYIKIIVVTAFVLFTLPLIAYRWIFNGSITDNDQNWSNFGSFWGGVGGAIFSFASFMALILTYSQSVRDKKADDEINQFFQLLELLGSTEDRLYFKTSEQAFRGRETISRYILLANKISGYYNSAIERNLMEDIKGLTKNPIGILISTATLSEYTSVGIAIKRYIDLIEIVISHIIMNKTIFNEVYIRLFLAQIGYDGVYITILSDIDNSKIMALHMLHTMAREPTDYEEFIDKKHDIDKYKELGKPKKPLGQEGH